MAFTCGECGDRHLKVAEARRCYGIDQSSTPRKPAAPGRRPSRRASPKKATKRRSRQSYPETYGGATGFIGKGSPPPRDAELHRGIGPTQNYGDNT
jgi:hypothetical protein